MTLKEDLLLIAEKEGHSSIEAFLEEFIQNQKNSFRKLKSYIERKYKRWYSLIHYQCCCRPYIKGRLSPDREHANLDPNFCYPKQRQTWNARAQALGYSTLQHLLEEHPGTDTAIALELKTTRQTIYNKRRRLFAQRLKNKV